MSATRQVLLIRPHGAAGVAGLAQALRDAGAQVREVDLSNEYEPVLDALEQGFVPVVLKTPANG
ncbi:MAG: hypothetical protein KJ011_12410 [Burkholderiaceae bacterium]|nr:hypothetical protein [Burkholderiaceae bacterium]